MHWRHILYLILFGLNTASTQSLLPSNGRVFDDTTVPRVDITIAPNDLARILGDVLSDDLYPAQFTWTDDEGSIDLEKVGFRLRGNTSRVSAKKSFKIKFNTYGGDEFYGLSDLNLNGEHNDPTISRAKLCWDLLKEAKIPSARANHVELYINGEYRGLYANVEHIDKDYINSRYDDRNGNLYKLYYGCDFNFLGQDPNAYKVQQDGRRVYELKTNEDVDNYTNLAEFIKILNRPAAPDFRCQLESIFDIDLYLRSMAMEVIIGHWDNPIFNKNNAYLYEDPQSNLIKYITFDLDNTFGIDWFGIDWSERNIYQWDMGNGDRPIYTNILNVPEYKNRYSYYLNQYVDHFFNDIDLFDILDQLQGKLEPFVVNDLYHSYDYGYSINDFNNNFNNAIGAHVKSGLKEYIEKRSVNIKLQLESLEINPIFRDESHKTLDNQLIVEINIEAPYDISTVIKYRLDGGSWESNEMKDDGEGIDQVKGDGIYSHAIHYNTDVLIEYYFEAIGLENKYSRFPFCGAKFQNLIYISTEPTGIRINEFMASNNTIADEFGEYEDWIELYNDSNEDIDLSDYYLTDDTSNPTKWKLPPKKLQSKSYLLIWADEDQNQGVFHANFKLSKSGEYIGLHKVSNQEISLVDDYTYLLAQQNISYGLIPNGIGDIITLNRPTPGRSNLETTISTDLSSPQMTLYPNPVNNRLQIKSSEPIKYIDIYNTNGKLVYSIMEERNQMDLLINLEDLNTGVYIIKINKKIDQMTRKLIKL